MTIKEFIKHKYNMKEDININLKDIIAKQKFRYISSARIKNYHGKIFKSLNNKLIDIKDLQCGFEKEIFSQDLRHFM